MQISSLGFAQPQSLHIHILMKARVRSFWIAMPVMHVLVEFRHKYSEMVCKKTIRYASRSFSDVEKRYWVTCKELLAANTFPR